MIDMMFIPTRTKRITDNIFAVKTLMVNLFILKDGDNIICIDTGFGRKRVKREISKLGIDPKAVSHIFLTHSDHDHVNCIDLFENADIYLSADEEQMINGTTARASGVRYNRPITRKYTLLKDEEAVQIGNLTVKGIATPGHTPGSMSYLVDGTYLFVGDSFAITNGKVHTFPRFITMDTATQKESIKKLAGLKDIKMVLTAHSGYADNFAASMRQWV